jgi:phenylacetate-CoA ligase
MFLSAGALEKYQGRCLETLDTALRRTPMYRSWQSFDPGESFPVDLRYAALPELSKSDIRAHFPNGVVPRELDLEAALARNEIAFVKTSGTADESLMNIWNQAWWNESERASWSLNAHAARVCTGSHREAILASALSVGPRSKGLPVPRSERMLRHFLFLNEYGSTAEWPQGHENRIRAELADYAPAVLEANPSLLARFSRWAWREGKVLFQPRLITLTYEFPSAVQLRAIRRVFSSPIASSYGSTEAGYVLMECEHGRLHQNSDFCRIDLVPVEGMEDPNVGRILATTLGNQWFPLLRFEIGDLARVSTKPCPCGRAFGVIASSIEGRLLSLFVGSRNRLITHRQLDEMIASVEGIGEYRLDQSAPGSVLLRLVADGSRPVPSFLRDARDAIGILLGREIVIQAEEVNCLLPEESGKFLLAKRHFPLNLRTGQTGAFL